MKALPSVVGLANPTSEVALLRIKGKAYPNPVFIYLVESDRIIEYRNLNEGMKALFHPASLSMKPDANAGSFIVDTRTLFKGSKEYFTPDIDYMLDLTKHEDFETDVYYRDLFTTIEHKWIEYQNRVYANTGEPRLPAYLSFKNSYIVALNTPQGLQSAVVYFKDEFSLTANVYSELDLNGIRMIIRENNFSNLIDARYAKSIIEKEYSKIVGESSLMNVSYSKELSLDVEKLYPALPPEVMLSMSLLQTIKTGLSYFDKMLRTRENIIPINMSKDKNGININPIFNHISLNSIRDDEVASKCITSFGTVSGMTDSTINLSYQSFKGDLNLL